MTNRTPNDPIDAYLDTLFARLKDRGPSARRLMAETESHLQDAVQSGVDDGLSLEEAQENALYRFGAPNVVARAVIDDDMQAALPVMVAETIASAWQLVSVGLLSIAASGLVAAAMVVAFGKSFVFAGRPGELASSSACAHWLKVQPQAHTCAQALTAENYDDGLQFRFLFGVLGLLAVGLGLLIRHRRRHLSARILLDGVSPGGFTAIIGSAVFGGAAIYLGGYGIDQIVQSQQGAGQWLSAAGCAAVVAVGYLMFLVKTLLERAAVLRTTE